ncbi:MAG: acyl-CoA thioester hydrolase [Acidimicrobiaceae bacterium]|jgi:acyl-CoA thioester hydrolase
MAHVHEVTPRYGEIDMQGVVFNAHYLAYCDDAVDKWFRTLFGQFEDDHWDIMLKKAEVTWHGAARLGDVLAIAVAPARFGNTSLDIGFEGTVDGAPVFSAVITYVCVEPRTTKPIRVPDDARERLAST